VAGMAVRQRGAVSGTRRSWHPGRGGTVASHRESRLCREGGRIGGTVLGSQQREFLSGLEAPIAAGFTRDQTNSGSALSAPES